MTFTCLATVWLLAKAIHRRLCTQYADEYDEFATRDFGDPSRSLNTLKVSLQKQLVTSSSFAEHDGGSSLS